MTDNKDIIRSIRVHLNEASGCGGCTYYKYFPEATCFLHMIADAADALEAADKRIAELIPKEGEWIMCESEKPYIVSKCSVCGGMTSEHGHYCPNCGAKMNMKKGKQE